MNIWDVGGQKSLRSYWRNYFESTDGLVWVVDSADRMRLNDCKQELKALLVEEVCHCGYGNFVFAENMLNKSSLHTNCYEKSHVQIEGLEIGFKTCFGTISKALVFLVNWTYIAHGKLGIERILKSCLHIQINFHSYQAEADKKKHVIKDCSHKLRSSPLYDFYCVTSVAKEGCFCTLLCNNKLTILQRLAGATLLVFANKQDLPGSLSSEAIKQVSG